MAMLTLAEYYKLENKDPFRSLVLKNIIRHSPVFDIIPFKTVAQLAMQGIRWRNLPDVAFRAVGEGYTASHGAVELVDEALYGYGGDINFDRVYEKLDNVATDPVKLQVSMKMMSMGFKFNDKLINADTASSPKEFLGLKARIAAMPSRQKVGFAGASATGLDVTASSANAQTFFQKLSRMSKNTNGGDHDVWLCNEDLQLGIGLAAKYIQASGGNWLDTRKDVLGREFMTLHGSPIIDIGLKKDQSTEIITNTEVAGDAGADSTSIYCVAFNEMQGLIFAQLEELNAYDPLNGGEQESTPSKLRRIDWWIGPVAFGSYGITRGWNIHDPSGWTIPA